MQTVTCHFKDERALRHNLMASSARTSHPTMLRFEGPATLCDHQSVRLVVHIERYAERLVIDADLAQASLNALQPSGAGQGKQQYYASVRPDDRVWLEAFLSKLDTMRRFHQAA